MAEVRPILLELPDQLVGERVVLRPWRESDAAAFYALIVASREHIQRWLPWPEQYHSVDDARAFLRRQAGLWMLRENFTFGIFDASETLLGSVGLHPQNPQIPSFEIGYWLGAAFEGKGYMTEAVNLVTRLAFEVLEAKRVYIRCDAANERSAKVARRCGFVYEGTHRSDHLESDGRLTDTKFFSRVPGDRG